MSVLSKRNVINKVYKVLELLLVQSEIIMSAKTEASCTKAWRLRKPHSAFRRALLWKGDGCVPDHTAQPASI